MPLRIAQKAARSGDGWWDWSAWIEGDSSELDRVEQVTWILHPTFPDPTITVTDRASKFRIDRSGWGEFRLGATLWRRDGTSESLEQDLVFDPEAAEESAEVAKPRRVFLSFALGDYDVAQEVKAAIDREGWKIDLPAPSEYGGTIASEIERAMKATDAVILIKSGSSQWVEREGRLAFKLKKPVLEVVMGQGAVGGTKVQQRSSRSPGVAADSITFTMHNVSPKKSVRPFRRIDTAVGGFLKSAQPPSGGPGASPPGLDELML